MKFVVHSSVAVKWVSKEAGSDRAAALLGQKLWAPELLLAECSNVLWKKVRRGELSAAEARAACSILVRAPMELTSMKGLAPIATDLALTLDHPAFDCVYLALAREQACPLVTSDLRLFNRLAQSPQPGIQVQLL